MSNELKFNDDAIKIVEVVGERFKSNTQSIKVILIEKDGEKFVSLQKWWRKSSDDPWSEGKGFHLNAEDVEILRDDLNKVLDMLD